jgi:DNA polymerase (family X)
MHRECPQTLADLLQWQESEVIRQQLGGIVLLKDVELDILPDGMLDLPDEGLEGFDIVLLAVHSDLNMTKAPRIKHLLKAIAHPAVDMLPHPPCRQLNTREPLEVDVEAVFHTVKEHDVAVERDGHPQRLDWNDVHGHRACELDLKRTMETDAHSVDHLRFRR